MTYFLPYLNYFLRRFFVKKQKYFYRNMNYKYQVLITQDSMRCKQDYSFPEHFDERLQKNVKMSTVLTNYRGMRIYLSRMAIRRWENPDYTPRPELFVQFKERQVWHLLRFRCPSVIFSSHYREELALFHKIESRII